MKLEVTLTEETSAGPQSARAITVDQGETLEQPVAFTNSDGTPRYMVGATISVRTLSARSDEPLPDGAGVTWGEFTDEAGVTATGLRLSATASGALRRGGRYVIEITETRSAANPPRVSIAELELRVE